MTAPLFHLSPGALEGAAVGSSITLTGAEGHHAATVMRLGVGEQVLLSDTQQTQAIGVVVAVGSGELTIQLSEVEIQPAQLPRLVLVQALAKDKRDLQAAESATELGVDAIIPWQAERSVARWKPGREEKKHAEWVNLVTASAKQTRRTSIPEVRQLRTTAQYCQQIAGTQEIGVVVLHEVQERSLRSCLTDLGALETRPAVQELHLVVGPEGGISEREIEQLTAAGAYPARLGTHVLRSSTAGPAAIAGTQLLLGRWEWD